MSAEGPLLYNPSLIGAMHYPHHTSTTMAPSTSASMGAPSLNSTWLASSLNSTTPYLNQHTTNKSYMVPHSSTMTSHTSPPMELQTSFPRQTQQSLSIATSYDTMAAAAASRPHSSPSSFGPNQEDLMWASNPLRISSSGYEDQAYQTASFTSPTQLMHSPRVGQYDHDKRDIRTPPQSQRLYQSIAPNPVGIASLGSNKRAREDDDAPETPAKRRQRSASLAISPELGEEDRLLFKLKDEDNLPWKDIAARFKTDLGKNYQVPALQMRFKRLRERLRVWTDVDVNALRMAQEYWQKNKFEIIASKMIEFGSAEKWSARQCAKKWQELAPNSDIFIHNSVPTPFSHTSSPIEGPGYISYLNL